MIKGLMIGTWQKKSPPDTMQVFGHEFFRPKDVMTQPLHAKEAHQLK
jgi:hypothetical protein